MSNGFLYAISGAERYFQEGGDSVRSLRRHSPAAHATLVSDALPASLPGLASSFDTVVTQPLEPATGRNVSPHVRATTYRVRNIYRHSPYDRTCHVDSDTYFLADCQPIFGILDYFDMAMTLAPSDITPIRVNGRELVGYTPYNCGVIVFRKGELTERFFERWGYWQDQALDDPEATGNDQVTFMRALLEVPCRICVMHHTWNARTTGHELFRGPVRVIHGRHVDVEAVARDINVVADLRVWIPKVEVCLYDGMSVAHHLRYCITATWLLWRSSLRRLVRRLKRS